MTQPIKLPPQEVLRRILNYDASTGVFTWTSFAGRRAKVGSIAGKTVTRGYRQIKIGGVLYRANRLAWVYSYGEDPGPLFVDHIDGNTSNNAIHNLRLVNPSQSCMNRGLMRNNKSGFSGVFWANGVKRWQAYYRINRKLHHLGLFDNIVDAVAARIRFARKHFGEFGRFA